MVATREKFVIKCNFFTIFSRNSERILSREKIFPQFYINKKIVGTFGIPNPFYRDIFIAGGDRRTSQIGAVNHQSQRSFHLCPPERGLNARNALTSLRKCK